MTEETILRVLQRHIGGCREDLGVEAGFERCGRRAEYVLWGKLIPAEGLGPRCYDHAAKHVGHNALASRSGWAIVNLAALAYEMTTALQQEER
jgi:hypothetical protein